MAENPILNVYSGTLDGRGLIANSKKPIGERMANTTKQSRNEKLNPKPVEESVKGVRLKQWGSGILLLAFVTQQGFLVNYIGKLDNYFRNYQTYSNAYNSSLLYENLYFSEAAATQVLDGMLLKKAAADNIAGFSIRVIDSGLPVAVKQRMVGELTEIADKVTDIDSYNKYMNALNKDEGEYLKATQEDYSELNTFKTLATWVYLGMYIIGSALLIIAVRYK